MEEWIRRTFICVPNGWNNEDGTKCESFQFTRENNEGKIVPVRASMPQFLARFGAITAPPTATALKAADPDNVTGWHDHFDAWVAQGIIQP